MCVCVCTQSASPLLLTRARGVKGPPDWCWVEFTTLRNLWVFCFLRGRYSFTPPFSSSSNVAMLRQISKLQKSWNHHFCLNWHWPGTMAEGEWMKRRTSVQTDGRKPPCFIKSRKWVMTNGRTDERMEARNQRSAPGASRSRSYIRTLGWWACAARQASQVDGLPGSSGKSRRAGGRPDAERARRAA